MRRTHRQDRAEMTPREVVVFEALECFGKRVQNGQCAGKTAEELAREAYRCALQAWRDAGPRREQW